MTCSLDVWTSSTGLLGPPSITSTGPKDLLNVFETNAMPAFFALKVKFPAPFLPLCKTQNKVLTTTISTRPPRCKKNHAPRLVPQRRAERRAVRQYRRGDEHGGHVWGLLEPCVYDGEPRGAGRGEEWSAGAEGHGGADQCDLRGPD